MRVNIISKIIREWYSRSKLNTYSELGRKIGVSQQTVSKWAHGISRPSLEHEKLIISIIASESPKLYSDGTVRPSVLQLLPLQILASDSFEDFCLDLFRYSGYGDMKKLGKKGESQFGIDLYSNEKKIVVQCKQTNKQKFDSNKVKGVIKKYNEKINLLKQRLNYTPQNKILAVSTKVTDQNVRELERNGWDVYDIEELSRIARELNENNKIRLIERYFIGNRQDIMKNCLGVDGHTFGLTFAKSYFERIDGLRNCFTLSNQYISSFSKLDTLSDLFQEYRNKTTSDLSSIIITGNNGVGKTRLLKEFCEKYSKLDIVIVEKQEVMSEYDIIRAFESDVIIIDDAHRYIDTIRRLFSAYKTDRAERILQKKKPILIISARSANLDLIKEIFFEYRFTEPNDYSVITLENPTIEQCYKVVAGIIENAGLAKAIVEISDNNLFVATTLATGICNGRISQLNVSKLSMPESVLYVFLGDLAKYGCGLSHCEGDAKSILNIIALMQPIDLDSECAKVISKQTGVSELDVVTIVEKLLKANILIKQRGMISVYPEVLGVYICYEFLKGGFESRNNVLRFLLKGRYQINTLSNLALLDSEKLGTISDIMSEAWKTIKANYINSSIVERTRALNDLVNISFYQPREAIEFARMVLSSNDDVIRGKPPIEDFNTSIRAIASILENVAHRTDYIDKAICMLVELASKFNIEDVRKNSALDAIQNLLRPGILKPAGYRKNVLDSLLSCIKNSPDQNMFVKLLSSSLDTSSMSYLSDNKTIMLLQSNHNNADTESQEICETILKYSQSIIDDDVFPLKIAVIELLGDIVNYKLIQDDNLEVRNKIINYLYNLCNKETDPVIVVKIYLELQRCYSDVEKLDLLIKNADSIVAVFTLDPYFNDLFSYEADSEKRQLRLKEWVERSVGIVIKEYGADPGALYNLLMLIREKANTCSLLYKSDYLLGVICSKMPNDFNRKIVQSIKVGDSGEEFQYAIAALLTSEEEKRYCIDAIKSFVNSGNHKLIVAAASAVAYCFDKIDTKVSLDLIALIVETNNVDAILVLIRCSNRILDYNEDIIKDLLFYFCKIKDSRIALCITELFSGHNGKRLVEKLQLKDVENIFSVLGSVLELDNSAQVFICNVSNIFPDSVATFFLNRISNKSISLEYNLFNYVDIPNRIIIKLDDNALNIFLAKIVSWVYDNIDQPMIVYNARKILKTLYLDEKAIMREIVRAKDRYIENKNKASQVIVEVFLSLLNICYIANNYDSIEPILQALMMSGGISKEKLLDIFTQTYVPSFKSRTPGNPSEYDLKLIDISEKALLVMPYGSILRQLFEKVKIYAEREINDDKKMDKEWGL